MAPLGVVLRPAFAAGARAGLAELAPSLIGQDAAQPLRSAEHMDAALRGHPYVKSAIDMACWDAAARHRGHAAVRGAGRRASASPSSCTARSRRWRRTRPPRGRRHRRRGLPPAAGQGRRRPALDAERLAAVREAARRGHRALRRRQRRLDDRRGAAFVRRARQLDHVLEQPCETLAECRRVRSTATTRWCWTRASTRMAALLRRLARRHRRRRDDQDRPGRRGHPGGPDPGRRGRAGA